VGFSHINVAKAKLSLIYIEAINPRRHRHSAKGHLRLAFSNHKVAK